MKRKIIIAVVIVLAIVAVLAGVKTWQIRTLIAASQASVQPPETVSAAVVHEEKWPDTLTAIGSISAEQGVTVSPEIAGKVSEIAFESGALVAKGRPAGAARYVVGRGATAGHRSAGGTGAAQRRTRPPVAREQYAFRNPSWTRRRRCSKQNQANADAIRATIEKKNIRAPFAGQLGIRLVNLGELLDVGKPIVSLQSLSPVYADFSLPQQELARLQTGLPVRVSSDTYPDQRFEGTLTAINPDLDQTTRSVRLQATFENAEKQLRPGMFVRVEVVFPEEQTVLAVPATAILSAPYGDSVYVIESNRTNSNFDGPSTVCPHRPVAGRFHQRGNGFEGRRPRGQRRHFQASQRHARAGKQPKHPQTRDCTAAIG